MGAAGASARHADSAGVFCVVAVGRAERIITRRLRGLSVFSCLFVTKDEPVHSKHCRPNEQWLHAMLFSLHPLVLLSGGLLWPAWRRQTLSFIRYTGFERKFLLGNTLLTLAFGLYQLVYWNFIWQPATSQKQAG